MAAIPGELKTKKTDWFISGKERADPFSLHLQKTKKKANKILKEEMSGTTGMCRKMNWKEMCEMRNMNVFCCVREF